MSSLNENRDFLTNRCTSFVFLSRPKLGQLNTLILLDLDVFIVPSAKRRVLDIVTIITRPNLTTSDTTVFGVYGFNTSNNSRNWQFRCAQFGARTLKTIHFYFVYIICFILTKLTQYCIAYFTLPAKRSHVDANCGLILLNVHFYFRGHQQYVSQNISGNRNTQKKCSIRMKFKTVRFE